jgi:putative membrane protein
MGKRSYRTFQALILAGLGLFLLNKVWSGSILLFINRRFVLPVFLASLLLIILSQIIFRERPAPGMDTSLDENEPEQDAEARSGWNLWWLALPVIVGILVPIHSLGSYSAGQRGVNLNAPLVSGANTAQVLSIPSEQRSVLDWVQAFHTSADLSRYAGLPVDVTGFVYHDPRLPAGEFMVSRFAVTCCVADALAVGMIVSWSQALSYPGNTWVRVRGQLQAARIDGQALPGIRAQAVELIPEPDQPYLFP